MPLNTDPIPPDPLLLGGGGVLQAQSRPGPDGMYRTASEMADVIRTAIFEVTGVEARVARALESGVVEEYAFFQVDKGEKSLCLRMWPIFFTADRRVEYTLYTDRPDLVDAVMHLMKAFAGENAAILKKK